MLDMLNENLRIELIVHLNGKMLHDSKMFKYYTLTFLSELTFILKRETFAVEEPIFEEDTPGDKLYYITKGNVILVHKRSATFIADISIDSFLGEISFFSGQPRKASARSIAFTEMMALSLSEFFMAAAKHEGQVKTFLTIQRYLNREDGDLSILGVNCYICKRKGHIAT